MLGCFLKNKSSSFITCFETALSLPKFKGMQPKTPSESRTIMTDMVLPSETNPLNNLFGGELLARMDRAASIAARRHSRRITVTASVNHVAFNRNVPLGSVVPQKGIILEVI